jgi:ADP-heptose:LPS heptosyltransferase
MLNKEWSPERFQRVVNRLRPVWDLVQIGAPGDPLLAGVIDARGTGLREAAAVLSRSQVFIGQEGFFMHLARAVECRAVIVFGGRVRPTDTGYSCNENLFSPVPCAPCWQNSRCEHGRRCLDLITVDAVEDAARRALARAEEPLVEDTACV